MTLLLFLTGLTTVASSGSTAATNTGGLFAVSGTGINDAFPVTAVSYTYAPMSKRTE